MGLKFQPSAAAENGWGKAGGSWEGWEGTVSVLFQYCLSFFQYCLSTAWAVLWQQGQGGGKGEKGVWMVFGGGMW